MKHPFAFCALLAACLAGSANAVENGTVIDPSTYPAVRKIVLRGSGTCTGTFIGPRTMITAAHCAEYAQDGDRLDLTVEGFRPIGFKIHPRYASHAPDAQAYDVAVLQFDTQANFAHVALATQPLKEGDSVTIVGFGEVNGIAGTMRMGKNRIYQTIFGQYTIITTPYSADSAVATGGDSGGPMFDESGALAATTGRRNLNRMTIGGETTDMSSHVSVAEPEIAAFVRESCVALATARAGGRAGH